MFKQLILTAAFVTLPNLSAQEAPLHRLRVLALGDPPPFIQEVRDGARYEVAPPVGAVPPRWVTLPTGPDPGVQLAAEAKSMRLRLGSPSAAITLPTPKSLRVDLKREEGTKWLNVPLHPCGSSLALVWRWGQDWNQARTLVLPDDAATRSVGSVHFANLTASPMAVVFGPEKIRLDPGKTFSRHLAADAPAVALEILFPMPTGEFKLCHSAMLKASPGNFSRVLMYAADGKKPRVPVKVLELNESC
jgi:hypothetical protein